MPSATCSEPNILARLSWTQQPLPEAVRTPSGEGTYLIAGGLGGLGLLVADWLVERQVRNLVLVSRSGPNEAVQIKLKALGKQRCASDGAYGRRVGL